MNDPAPGDVWYNLVIGTVAHQVKDKGKFKIRLDNLTGTENSCLDKNPLLEEHNQKHTPAPKYVKFYSYFVPTAALTEKLTEHHTLWRLKKDGQSQAAVPPKVTITLEADANDTTPLQIDYFELYRSADKKPDN